MRKISNNGFKSFFVQQICSLYAKDFVHHLKGTRSSIIGKIGMKKRLKKDMEKIKY